MTGFDMEKTMRASAEALEVYMVTLAGNKRIAEAHAKYIRALYESLVRAGFTEEQALQITAGASLPGTR